MAVERVPYTEVPSLAVGPRSLLADFALSLAVDELAIASPAIRWFRRVETPAGWPWEGWHDDRHLAGLTQYDDPSSIWLSDELARGPLVDAVAHEAHHVRWIERTGRGGRTPRETEVMERAAVWFAREFTRRHFGRFER